MSYDEIRHLTEIERITNEKPRYLDMDEAFCARMCTAIAAGLESPPIGVITRPGTKKPKYLSELTPRYHRPRNTRLVAQSFRHRRETAAGRQR